MQVRSYTFQSPYSQPTQVGRLDPSSVKEEKSTQEQNEKDNNTQSLAVNTQKVQPELLIKPSRLYQTDAGYNDLASTLKTYMDVSKDANRSANLNTYAKNGSDLSSLTKVNSGESSQTL